MRERVDEKNKGGNERRKDKRKRVRSTEEDITRSTTPRVIDHR